MEWKREEVGAFEDLVCSEELRVGFSIEKEASAQMGRVRKTSEAKNMTLLCLCGRGRLWNQSLGERVGLLGDAPLSLSRAFVLGRMH